MSPILLELKACLSQRVHILSEWVSIFEIITFKKSLWHLYSLDLLVEFSLSIVLHNHAANRSPRNEGETNLIHNTCISQKNTFLQIQLFSIRTRFYLIFDRRLIFRIVNSHTIILRTFLVQNSWELHIQNKVFIRSWRINDHAPILILDQRYANFHSQNHQITDQYEQKLWTHWYFLWPI